MSKPNLLSKKSDAPFTRIRQWASVLETYVGILVGLALMAAVFSWMMPRFLTVNNLINILRQVAINSIIAFGMTFIILIGGIDLSVGSVLALTGTFTAGLVVRNHLPIPVAMFAGLALGLALGTFNGIVISRTSIPPFIVTLAMMQIARGSAYVYTGGKPIRTTAESFTVLGTGSLADIPGFSAFSFAQRIPLPIIYTLLIFLILLVVLNQTKFGRWVYAIGGNREAALFSGIKCRTVEVVVYALGGLLAAFSGIVLASRLFSGQPTVGQGFELDAIAAVIIGGTSFSGGVGTLGGTLLGALVIGVLDNGLNVIGVNAFWQNIVKGAVLLLAVFLDTWKRSRRR